MRMGKSLWVAICTAGVALAVAPATDAQPKGPKERHEDRKERREERREDRKEKHDDKVEKHKELKEKRDEKRVRHQELKDKEKAGSLTDDEKKELEQMEGNHARIKERHQALKAKYDKFKETEPARRRAARRAAIKAWGKDHLHKPKVNAELRKHARRMAYLNRLKAIATAEGNADAVTRIDELIASEKSRHQSTMSELTK